MRDLGMIPEYKNGNNYQNGLEDKYIMFKNKNRSSEL